MHQQQQTQQQNIKSQQKTAVKSMKRASYNTKNDIINVLICTFTRHHFSFPHWDIKRAFHFHTWDILDVICHLSGLFEVFFVAGNEKKIDNSICSLRFGGNNGRKSDIFHLKKFSFFPTFFPQMKKLERRAIFQAKIEFSFSWKLDFTFCWTDS